MGNLDNLHFFFVTRVGTSPVGTPEVGYMCAGATNATMDG